MHLEASDSLHAYMKRTQARGVDREDDQTIELRPIVLIRYDTMSSRYRQDCGRQRIVLPACTSWLARTKGTLLNTGSRDMNQFNASAWALEHNHSSILVLVPLRWPCWLSFDLGRDDDPPFTLNSWWWRAVWPAPPRKTRRANHRIALVEGLASLQWIDYISIYQALANYV